MEDYLEDARNPTSEDMASAYDDYTANVNETLGTVVTGKNGYIVPLRGYLNPSYTQYGYHIDTYPNYSYYNRVVDYSTTGWSGLCLDSTYLANIIFPYAGYITPIGEANVKNCEFLRFSGECKISNYKFNFNDNVRIPVSPGSNATVYSNIETYVRFTANVIYTVYYRFAIYYEPYNYNLDDFTSSVGGSKSRIGDILTNYGYYAGDDLIIINDESIVSETNNTYYNPVTNTTSTINDWTYDYSSRTYSVTTDNSQTISVNYGDEQITIVEGDTVYNVYYVAEANPPHVHNYVVESETPATCTFHGSRKYICHECGDIKFDTIPATGHRWEIRKEVQTEYDNDGNLVVEGYTIYRCSNCGEEYKSTSGVSPPGGGDGGDSGSGGKGIFKTVFGVFSDFIGFFADLFGEFVVGGIRSFWDMITDTASDIFGFLNPFNWFD